MPSAMLEVIRSLLHSGGGRFRPEFEFQETSDWMRAVEDFRDAPDP